MKRFTLLLCTSALIPALCSCERESFPTQEQNSLRAVITNDEPDTKTLLIDNPGVRMVSGWAEGDKIGIFGDGAANQMFTIDASTLSDNAKSADFSSSSSIPKGILTGYYPYQEGAETGSSNLTLTFPASQLSNSVGGALERPDPSANILVGSGSAEKGICFRPAMALLKIGHIFDSDITLTKVEFRDLSGAAVAGTVSIPVGEDPVASVTGDEKAITLEFPGGGIFIPERAVHPLFIFVPARNYDKGFSLTFIDSNGGKTVRTVGASGGKTLSRGILYPIGDVSGKEYVPQGKSVLKKEATLVTEEMADKVRVIQITSDVVRGVDGEPIKEDYYYIHRPALMLLVHDDLAPEVGHWFIFDYGNSQMPEGGIFKVESVSPLGGGYSQVYATTEPNFGAPFKEISMGEDMFDAEGNELDGTGTDLDIGSYLSEIRDAEGNSVPFSVRADGTICLTERDMANVMTRATSGMSKEISLPELSVDYSEGNCSAKLGATVKIGMRAAIKVFDGEVDFVHCIFHPTIDLHASFSIGKDFSFSKNVHLFTLYFAPGIPVAPGVIVTPTMDVSAGIGLSASVKLSTSIDYTYDLGRFGFSYLRGQGFLSRHFENKPDETSIKPQLGASLTAKAGARASIIASPSIQFYGLFGAGLNIDYGITFSVEYNGSWNGTAATGDAFMALTPDLTITPYTASLGGWFTKKWDIFKLEVPMDPLWKRFFIPKFQYIHSWVSYDHSLPFYREWKGIVNGKYCKLVAVDDNYSAIYTNLSLHYIFTGINGIGTRIVIPKDSPTLDEWDVFCDIETGTTGVPWNTQMTWGTEIGTYILEDPSYVARTPLSENKVFTIPSGEKKEISDESVSGRPDDFPEGRVRSFSIRAVNMNNGLSVVLYRSVPFTYYWPESPAGPYYKVYAFTDSTVPGGKTAKEQYDEYNASVWPADIPIPYNL